MPQAIPDAPAATPLLSTTSTSVPLRARCHAVESPWMPAPMTRTSAREGREGAVRASMAYRQLVLAGCGAPRYRCGCCVALRRTARLGGTGVPAAAAPATRHGARDQTGHPRSLGFALRTQVPPDRRAAPHAAAAVMSALAGLL